MKPTIAYDRPVFFSKNGSHEPSTLHTTSTHASQLSLKEFIAERVGKFSGELEILQCLRRVPVAHEERIECLFEQRDQKKSRGGNRTRNQHKSSISMMT